MDEPQQEQPPERRMRGIRDAIVTSLASKFASIGLQLIALPVAVRSIPEAELGLYVLMTGFLGFAALVDIGTGPALMRQISSAHAAGDRPREVRLLLAGAVISASFIVVSLAALGAATWSPEVRSFASEHTSVVVVAVAIAAIQVACSPALRAQAAYQELHVFNLFGCGGNVAAALALLWAAAYSPSAPAFLIAVYGIPALTQVLNSIYFLKTKSFAPSLSSLPDRHTLKALARDASLFAVPPIISQICREAPKFMLFQYSMMETAKYGLLLQVMTMGAGLYIMVLYPVFPAIADAHARQDDAWIQTALRRVFSIMSIYIAILLIGSVSIGSAVMRLYVGESLHFDHAVMASFACYIALVFWNHAGFLCYAALGWVALFTKLALVELGVFTALVLAYPPTNAGHAFAIAAIALLPTSLVWSGFAFRQRRQPLRAPDRASA